MEKICLFDRDILVKSGVILRPMHFIYPPVGLIIQVAHAFFPVDYPIWITRGAEECENGNPDSKHLICCAFDLRTRHLSQSINRKMLVSKMQVALGHHYFGYYGTYHKAGNNIEWIHFQYNGGL